MNRGAVRAGLSALGLAAAAVAGGCGSPPPLEVLPSAVTDPCAERLHDICGLLLLHHSIHGKLPRKLSELEGVAGPDGKQILECPVSGKAYLYDREGFAVPGQPGRVVLRDPLPSHAGIRWAIAVVDPGVSTRPLNARVIALVERREAREPEGEGEKFPRPGSGEE